MRQSKLFLPGVALTLWVTAACSPSNSSSPSQAAGASGTEAGAPNVAGGPSGAGAPSSVGSAGMPGAAGDATAGGAGAAQGTAGATTQSEGAKPSEACGAAVTAPTDGYQDLQVNNEARRFIVHLPATYDGKHPFPAITTYHSKGDDATQWDSVKFYYKNAAGANNVLVYMEALGDPTLGGDRSFERDPADDLLYVDAAIAWLHQHVCFDTNRLFALGHSNGATFVQDLGCHRGHVFRAIAAHAGNAGDMTGCDGPVPAWVSFGDGDNAGLVAVSKARRDFWTMANGCAPNTSPTDPAPCLLYAQCTSARPVELCEDAMGDHKWSAWMSGATATFFGRF